jgi:hypothetical protein
MYRETVVNIGESNRRAGFLAVAIVSRLQELECLGYEPLVGLEDAAMSSVLVNPERRIWQASGQVVGVTGRHHAIVISVGHQDGMLDA